jgi:hypothetical protein
VSGFGMTALALISDARAIITYTCDRCGGPIAIGDRVVPVQDEVWHRSCFYASRGTIHAFWSAKRVKARPEPTTDPRQLGLFGGDK